MHKKRHSVEDPFSVGLPSPASKGKKLQLIKRQAEEPLSQDVVLDGVFHELRNCLQSIDIGVDLLQFDHPETVESRTIALAIERATRLLREAQEYCFPPEPHVSTRMLSEVLTEAIDTIEREAGESCVQLYCPEMLPPFQYNWLVLGRVLERVFRCARSVLPSGGGELLVNVKTHQKRTRVVVEIRTDIHGKEALEVDEERIFTPFLRVGNYQTGLGLMLAHQIMPSCNGKLTFKKMSPSHAHFSLFLDVLPATIVSMEVEQEEDHVYVE